MEGTEVLGSFELLAGHCPTETGSLAEACWNCCTLSAGSVRVEVWSMLAHSSATVQQ